MQRRDLVETVLILVIVVLFCLPLFMIYSIQQEKINNLEKDMGEIKKELYNIRLDILTSLQQNK